VQFVSGEMAQAALAASTTRDHSTGYTCAVPAAVYVTIWLGFGFLLVSIPFGWIAARLGGLDIRKIGSGKSAR
jgi:hypothetical protein